MKADEKKCPQCAEVIKREALICRHCGYRFSEAELEASKRKPIPVVASGFAVLGIVAVLAFAGYTKTQSELAASTNVAAVEANADAVADRIDAAGNAMAAMNDSTSTDTTGWTYADVPDKMRGGVRKVATIESSDTVHLNPPYDDTKPDLHIRRDPKFGFNIYFTSEGQPLCRPFSNGHVSIKFDSGPVQTWGCTEAADGSPGVVFLESEKKLLSRIKTAKTMTVEDDYYDAGRQVFSFKVAGLKW